MRLRPGCANNLGRPAVAKGVPLLPRRTRVSNLVVIAYDDLDQAKQVMNTLSELVKEHSITLEDAVIVEHREDGKMKLHQPSMAGAGAATGALWGGLIGLLFFVPL